MTIDMSKDDFLGLLIAVSEGITSGLKNYRAAMNGCTCTADAAATAADTIVTEAAEAEAPAEAAKEQLTVIQMAAKVLKKAATPLSKDEIIIRIRERFSVDVNKTTLSMALNQAIKKHKAVKRVSHGQYTNISRKIETAAAPADIAEA